MNDISENAKAALCFLYPGQGAQYPGRGKDFYDRSTEVRSLFDLASESVGRDMKELLFEADAEELKKTENTQAAVTLMNLSVSAYLAEKGIVSDIAAGFSLGEYSALVDAGIIGIEDVFGLVIERGKAMSSAIELSGGTMAAVIGLEAAAIDAVLAPIDGVFPANYNAPLQTVISGTAGGVETAVEKLKEAGARRVIPLKVSGPFHTPLLEAAGTAFAEILEGYHFSDPLKPLYSNVTGGLIHSGEEARRLCVRQITSPVRWTRVEDALCAAGVSLLIESGPGKVLTGLWKSGPACAECKPTDTAEAADPLIESILIGKEQQK
jgi:[acyl-carrier-protein] S-malonyltransferase